MDNILGQLRTLVETDKTFMGPSFLANYAKIVFGKKPDSITQKSATQLAKEIKSFVETIKSKQKTIGVNLISLSDLETRVLQYVSKSFTMTNKVIDGDVALEKFKSLIAKDTFFNDVENLKAISIYTKQDDLSADLVSEIQINFSNKKTMYNALGQYEALRSFINNDYQSCQSWEEFVTKMSNLLKTALLEIQVYEYDAVNSLNLSSVSLKEVKLNNDNSKKISTGYVTFDSILTGGFQPQRIYMFGGISGGGKSLVLINFAYRAKLFIDRTTPKEERKKHAVLYLSLENSVTETRDRFVCCTLRQSIAQIENAVTHNLDSQLDATFKAVFGEDTTSINIVYRPAKSINVFDVQNIITDIERTTNRKVDICFIDYADKMSAVNASKGDQEWRDLGYIVDELKATSIALNIPIVTVTQLNRDTYQTKKSSYGGKYDGGKGYAPNGGNIAGSIRKRENVDFFAIFNFKTKAETVINPEQLDAHNYLENQSVFNASVERVECIIDKNRMGPDSLKFPTYIDYATYRLLNSPGEIVSLKQYTINTVDSQSIPENSPAAGFADEVSNPANFDDMNL